MWMRRWTCWGTGFRKYILGTTVHLFLPLPVKRKAAEGGWWFSNPVYRFNNGIRVVQQAKGTIVLRTSAYLHSKNWAMCRQYTRTKITKIFLMSYMWYCIYTAEKRMPSISMVTCELSKGILRLPDGNWPGNVSSFHSLTCQNNVFLD